MSLTSLIRARWGLWSAASDTLTSRAARYCVSRSRAPSGIDARDRLAYGRTRRAFSSGGTSSTGSTGSSRDPATATVVKACAACLVGLATIKTLPLMASHSVGHTIQLMDAREPFLIKAGISRLDLLLELESVHAAALQAGAVPALLRLIDRQDVPNDVILAALGVLRKLARSDEGCVQLLRDGAPAALERLVSNAEQSKGEDRSEDVVQEARQLAYELLGPMNRVPYRNRPEAE